MPVLALDPQGYSPRDRRPSSPSSPWWSETTIRDAWTRRPLAVSARDRRELEARRRDLERTARQAKSGTQRERGRALERLERWARRWLHHYSGRGVA